MTHRDDVQPGQQPRDHLPEPTSRRRSGVILGSLVLGAIIVIVVIWVVLFQTAK